jgi:hypothetical protein
MLVVRHGAAGDPDDVTPDRGWDVDAFDDALEYPESYNRAGGTGTDPELFYEGRPDELHLNSVGIFVLNLGDHPEHLEQSEECAAGSTSLRLSTGLTATNSGKVHQRERRSRLRLGAWSGSRPSCERDEHQKGIRLRVTSHREVGDEGRNRTG